MRLETITLHNFGTFHDETIQVEGIGAATIGGLNGRGKSTAFYDAPMWVLFDDCRRNPEDMVRLGETDMSVSLVFALHGVRYKATKSLSIRNRQNKKTLQLFIEEGGTWRPISQGKLADTQKQIKELLKANSRLVTSTCFAKQEEFSKLTKASASERKGIFTDALQIDQYQEWALQAGRGQTFLKAKLQDKHLQLSEQDAMVKTLPEVQQKRDEVKAQVEETYAQELESLARAIANHRTHETELAAQVQGMERVKTLLQGGHHQLKELHRRLDEYKERQTRLEKITERRDDIQAKVDEANRHRTAIQDLGLTIRRLDDNFETLQGQRVTIEDRLKTLDQHRESLRTINDQTRGLVNAYQQQRTKLGSRIDQAKTSIKLLDVVPCNAELQGKCQFTLQAVRDQRELPTLQEQYGHELTEDEIVRREDPEILNRKGKIQGEVIALENEHLPEQLADLKAKQGTILDQRKGALQAQKDHQDGIDSLKIWTDLVPELESASVELKGILDNVHQINNDISAHLVQQAEWEKEIKELPRLEDELASLRQHLASLLTKQTQLQEAVAQGRQHLGELEFHITQINQAQKIVTDLTQEITRLETTFRHYELLEKAYRQIPIMIFENAVPMVEQRANDFLSRITTNGMAIEFVTQRALKSRDGLTDTLDIIVRDDRGERPIEQYSGGERCRIDLAIRLAMSQLLMQRAGAHIETFVIDEGFASIDPEGIKALIEAMPVMTESFPLVFIITHDPRLKHALSTHLHVYEDGTGSHVRIENS